MDVSDLTLTGLILEAHSAINGRYGRFVVVLDIQFRHYAYSSPNFPSPLSLPPVSPSPSWSADSLGGSADVDITVETLFPDPSSPLSFSVTHHASSLFLGARGPGSPISSTGRVLGAVYGTPTPPPPPPPPPPVVPDYPRDGSFPGGFQWPAGFRWPSDQARHLFLPWYYVMYDNLSLPILKELPLVHQK